MKEVRKEVSEEILRWNEEKLLSREVLKVNLDGKFCENKKLRESELD